jgi:hypothetical protein
MGLGGLTSVQCQGQACRGLQLWIWYAVKYSNGVVMVNYSTVGGLVCTA